MNTKDIRLIVMDMDGTLLDPERKISEGNMAALKEAQKRGIHLAICSGRLAGDISQFVMEELQDCAVLSLNGAYCMRKPMEDVFANHVFSERTLRKCVQILSEVGIPFGCFAQNRLVLFGEITKMDMWYNESQSPFVPQVLWGMDGLERIGSANVNKILCYSPDQTRLNAAYKGLCKVEGLEISSSWEQNYELMPRGIGKGYAVRELAQHLGLDASEVMAIGDYDNDAGMIAYAGLGVAMGNAVRTIRDHADFVTKTNAEDGVAYAVRRFALD